MPAKSPIRVDLRPGGIWLAAIVSLLLCLYALSYSGVFRADDEHILASRAVSLALRGKWEEPQVFGNQRVQALIAQGDPATQIEPAQTVFGAALVSLARSAALGNVQALFSLNVYLTALTAGVVFLTVLALRYSPKTAAWCALLFGVGTMAWPYATTFYRDTVAMFLSSLAFLGWATACKDGPRRRLLGGSLMAIGLIGGMLAKNTVAALVPAFAIFGAVLWYRSDKLASTRLRLLISATVVIFVVLVIVVALPSTGPLARFSHTYYLGLLNHFLGSVGPELTLAFFGPFLSPAKSLLLFSPPLLLAILGIRRGMRAHPWFVVPALSFALWIALAQGLFYREQWAGATGWGLRYMLPALPPLMMIAAPVVDEAIRSRLSVARIGLYAVLLTGVIVQLAGVLVDWNLVYRDWQGRGLNPFSPAVAWDPQFFSVPGQVVNLFRPSTWTVAWQRTVLGGAAEAILAPVVAVALAILIVVVWRRSGAGSRLERGLFALFVALAVVLPSLPLWWAYRGDPYWGGSRPEFVQAITWASHTVSSGDVLVVSSYGTPLWSFWMNWWNREEPWYSLAFEIPSADGTDSGHEFPSDLTLALFSSIEGAYSRLWYVSSSDSPGYGLRTEAKWLDERYPLRTQRRFDGDPVEVEARLYDLPPSGNSRGNLSPLSVRSMATSAHRGGFKD